MMTSLKATHGDFSHCNTWLLVSVQQIITNLTVTHDDLSHENTWCHGSCLFSLHYTDGDISHCNTWFKAKHWHLCHRTAWWLRSLYHMITYVTVPHDDLCHCTAWWLKSLYCMLTHSNRSEMSDTPHLSQPPLSAVLHSVGCHWLVQVQLTQL